jgi:signal transduction histidine kinase
LSSDVVASAERITTAVRQASLRPASAKALPVPANAKLQAVLDETSKLIEMARSAQMFVEQLPSAVNIGSDAVSLDATAAKCRLAASPMAAAAGVQLEILSEPTGVVVPCNKPAVELALHQLLKNAISHSHRGECVRLSAKAGGLSRGRPIAEAIAEAHNGKFEVRSMPGQRLSAFFIFQPERIVSTTGRAAPVGACAERLAE